MKPARVATGTVWALNAALAAAIVFSSFSYVFFRVWLDPLRDVEPPALEPVPTSVARPPDWLPLQAFANPVVPREKAAAAEPEDLRGIDLLGTVPAGNPASVVAYLLVRPPRNAYVNAYVGEAVLQDGQPVAELAGWMLLRVTPDSAVFAREGVERELRIKDAPLLTGGTAPALPSTPADRSKLKPTRLHGSGNAESYAIDRAGASWAAENPDALMREVTLQDYAGGGVQLASVAPGSLAADLGFQAGDVIKSVNGQAVTSSLGLMELKNNPAVTGKQTLTLQFERAGQPRTVTISLR